MQNKHPATLPLSIPIIILAGGQSQRLRLNRQYKWALPFGNKQSLLQYIINKASKQSSHVVINGPHLDHNNEAYLHLKDYGLDIIPDHLPNFQGPLSGLMTSLHWAQEQGHEWVGTIACDTPFFPDDLFPDLLKHIEPAINPAQLAVTVSSNERLHPVFGLWSTQLYDELNIQLHEHKLRSISRWARDHALIVNIDKIQIDQQQLDPFLNINTLDDYQAALSLLNKT